MKTSSEVRNSFSVNAGVDVNTKKVAFSASASYSKMQKTVLKNEKRVQSVSASFSSRHVQLKHADSLSLGADAQVRMD
nr:hypothetical protein BaRGS_010998 [Batillaria attramentaria]